ncbi:TatD DNase family protein [Mariprofundus aestuarium]|uniref:TatD DNase family protein n=1 Tax=Mariprofundus aestuarium TaxID=1921086 RepID=A0A2K8L042_MARES|nr:TatD family hydrolase [Mariprofundus aestuarium]ATX80627.1 TatD DNase family protein [Mariprofundus aestuarium]
MQLTDSHCHLDDVRFDHDRAEVIQRASEAGVDRFVVPAVSRRGWGKLQTIAAEEVSIYPAFGLHPWFCDEHDESDLKLLPKLLEGAVAIGECGLDTGLCRFDMERQLHWFRGQLRIAAEHDLPVIVHGYKALDSVIREIKCYPELRGVVHSFSGSQQQADQLIALGFYLGFGGSITDERARKNAAVVQAIPVEKLLIETDAPDQSPSDHRGKRNEPAFLIEILARIATLRAIDAESLARICNRNAKELFRL